MSIFSNILEKLGIRKPGTTAPTAEQPSESLPPSVPTAPSAPVKASEPSKPTKDARASAPAARTISPNAPSQFFPAAGNVVTAPAKPVEMPMVDVVSKLDSLAKASPIQLNWKVSINDLMALLGMDHTPAAIKELAVELGCPESEMGDSYKRNVWTHKELLRKIAENGGNIPKKLLD